MELVKIMIDILSFLIRDFIFEKNILSVRRLDTRDTLRETMLCRRFLFFLIGDFMLKLAIKNILLARRSKTHDTLREAVSFRYFLSFLIRNFMFKLTIN